MDFVKHHRHVDALRREGPVGWHDAVGARGKIGVARVVAEHAIFGVVPQNAVHLEIGVAVIAVSCSDHRPAGLDGGSVHREIHHLIRGSGVDGHLAGGSRQDRLRALRFHAHGVAAGGVGRDGVNERVGAIAAANRSSP